MSSNYGILRASQNKDLELWLYYLDLNGLDDPHCNPFYLSGFNNCSMREVCCFYIDCNSSIALIPFQLIHVNSKRYLSGDLDYYHASCPYGYSFIHCSVPTNVSHDFILEAFYRCAYENKIISIFARLPMDFDLSSLNHEEIRLNRNGVICNLERDYELIYSGYAHKVRKNIKRALNAGVQVSCDTSGSTLDSFLDIYFDTMERRGADSSYQFSTSFFNNIISNLKNNYAFINATYNNQVISTELILFSSDVVYSFLGGTYSEFFNLRPNDLLKDYIIKWSINSNKKSFVLGGGYFKSDGIYSYKLAFDKNGSFNFYTFNKILDNDAYDLCVGHRIASFPDLELDATYFPLYFS